MNTISVTSACSGTGVTHTAISIASALVDKGLKVCVVDRNVDNHDIECLGIECGYDFTDNDGDYFSYKGIDFVLYKERFSVASLRKLNYDFVILDCGTRFNDTVIQADMIVFVCSSRLWNRGREVVVERLEEMDDAIGMENLLFVFPFAEDKGELERFSEGAKSFFPAIENPFHSTFDVSLLGVKEEKKEKSFKIPLPAIPIKRDDSRMQELEETNSALALQLKEREKDISEVHFKAIHDALTHCKNRTGYDEDIKKYDVNDICIVNFDVNNLKKINDKYGHTAGDKLLTTIASELQKRFENVYRMGGDEFTVIGKKDLTESLPDTLKELDEYLASIESEFPYEVSYGFSNEGDCIDLIYSQADALMYADKRQKKQNALSLEELQAKKEAEERARLEEEKQRLEKERLEKELEEEKQKIKRQQAIEKAKLEEEIAKGLIPNTTFEPDEFLETETEKNLATMWYATDKVKFEIGDRYEEVTLYIYPLSYVESPFSCPTAVVLEMRGTYLVYADERIVDVPINNANSLRVSTRFNEDGLCISVDSTSEYLHIMDEKRNIHQGLYTPKYFGKQIIIDENTTMEVFPIRYNDSGLCDVLARIGNEFAILDGKIDLNQGTRIQFYLKEKTFVCESISEEELLISGQFSEDEDFY